MIELVEKSIYLKEFDIHVKSTYIQNKFKILFNL